MRKILKENSPNFRITSSPLNWSYLQTLKVNKKTNQKPKGRYKVKYHVNMKSRSEEQSKITKKIFLKDKGNTTRQQTQQEWNKI